MISPSEPIRLTVPISRELSAHLTLCAFASDLTRGQLVRRWLAESVREAERRHAALAGKTVDEWLNGISAELAANQTTLERLARAQECWLPDPVAEKHP